MLKEKGGFMARIMIVDDAMFMRKIIGDIIKKIGHEIIAEAGNGEEAFKKYSEMQPDLVFMDITMPEVDGIQGLKMIKSTYPEARIIMCSAMGQQWMVIDAIAAGARDFIVKPFQPDRIEEAVILALK